MKYLIFFTLCFNFSLTFSLDVQLEGGNEVLMEFREGLVSEHCGFGSESRINHYNCSDTSISAGSYGAVKILDGSLDADWVKLQRVGSKYIKGVKFLASESRSVRKINLWVSSVFQRPLLKRGENIIKYTFFKNKLVVLEGEFVVNVVDGDYIACRNGRIYSASCQGYYQVCSNYLYRSNYCR